MTAFDKIYSGIEGLDKALDFIRFGDNVVWQVSDIEEYAFFAEKLARQAIKEKRNLIYIRFAQHKPLLKNQPLSIDYSVALVKVTNKWLYLSKECLA